MEAEGRPACGFCQRRLGWQFASGELAGDRQRAKRAPAGQPMRRGKLDGATNQRSDARTELLVISPFARPGYISQTVYEFSSLLKFAEERFGLEPLTERDLLANDLLDSFDFSQDPSPPLILSERNCPFGEEGINREAEDPVVGEKDDPD
jgi:hypothetical protein